MPADAVLAADDWSKMPADVAADIARQAQRQSDRQRVELATERTRLEEACRKLEAAENQARCKIWRDNPQLLKPLAFPTAVATSFKSAAAAADSLYVCGCRG